MLQMRQAIDWTDDDPVQGESGRRHLALSYFSYHEHPFGLEQYIYMGQFLLSDKPK